MNCGWVFIFLYHIIFNIIYINKNVSKIHSTHILKHFICLWLSKNYILISLRCLAKLPDKQKERNRKKTTPKGLQRILLYMMPYNHIQYLVCIVLCTLIYIYVFLYSLLMVYDSCVTIVRVTFKTQVKIFPLW